MLIGCVIASALFRLQLPVMFASHERLPQHERHRASRLNGFEARQPSAYACLLAHNIFHVQYFYQQFYMCVQYFYQYFYSAIVCVCVVILQMFSVSLSFDQGLLSTFVVYQRCIPKITRSFICVQYFYQCFIYVCAIFFVCAV